MTKQPYQIQSEQIFSDDTDKDFKLAIREAKISFNSRTYWEPTRRQFYQKLKEIEKEQKISRRQARAFKKVSGLPDQSS